MPRKALVDTTQESRSLALLAEGRTMLAEARSLEDVKSVLDLAVAAKRYAEAKRMGEEAQRYAAEIVLRATRRMGEMLAGSPKNPGGNPLEVNEGVPTIRSFGITYDQSSRAQQLATIPEEDFERFVRREPRLTLKRAEREVRERKAAEAREQIIEIPPRRQGVELYEGDFRERLAHLTDVDAIITDPPYPGEFIPLYGDLAAFAARALRPSGVLAVMCGQTHLPEYIAQLSAHLAYRWTGAYIAQGQRTRMHQAKVGTGWKPILLYQRRDALDVRFLTDDLFDSAGDDKRFHHWGQSESGIASLVERLTKPGELVVDPFLGGGTAAVVCRDLGRRFVGCDIDRAAVAATVERVA